MNNVYEFEVPTLIYDQSSVWMAKLDRGLSSDEEEEFRAWMHADPRNADVLFEMAVLWDKMGVLSRLSEICPHPGAPESRSPRFFIAASLLILFAAGFWAILVHHHSPAERARDTTVRPVDTVYETAVGEQSANELTDGTDLVLNTNTRVKVQYAEDYRLLVLERGEIHVSVASDRNRPLSVVAGDRIIQAVGTAFNVEINSDQRVELVVTEGVVRVGVLDPLRTRPLEVEPTILPPSSIAVSAGEKTILGSEEINPNAIEMAEIAVKLSWREGNLVFRGESLEEALTEVGRYTEVEFVVLDEASKRVRVAGMFKAGDVQGLLAVLEKNFDVTYRRVGENRIELQGQ